MSFRQEQKFLTSFIIYLTFFLLGFFVSYNFYFYNAEKKEFNNEKTLLNSEKKPLDMEKYFYIYNLLEENFYDFDSVKKEDLIEKSIVGLIYGLKDPYTEYFNKQENKDFMESLSGDFHGIGAVLEKNDLGVKITSVIKNSPAEEGDLKEGDIIVTVNGTEIANMSTKEVITLIKGPAGKEVNLTILRKEKFLEKKLFTREIIIPSILAKDLDNEIGYIALATFGEKTGDEFEKELEKFKNKKGIIIDLRQNGGGFLETANGILSNFIKKGEVLAFTKYRNGKVDKYFSHGSENIYNGKIVILVDSGSASASEIVAGAMKDYKKAILVGEKTYGKGSVQDPIELSDGSMVKITTAKWFTPNDKNIDKEGIEPDIKVEITDEDIEKKYDRQLEEAKKILHSFIENDYLQLSIDKYNEKNKKS